MNPSVRFISEKILYQGWSTLTEYILEYTRKDKRKEKHVREIYDSGDGAAILLYNSGARKITLVRQFRLPAYLNGHPDGMLLEACAGMLDLHHPEAAIIKEVEEETGIRLQRADKVFEAFATPGAHKEKIHFFTGAYDESMRISKGGGLHDENEDIEVVEIGFDTIDGLLISGSIVDIKTLALIYYGKTKGLI
jgi:GDP-mannose pyrophosphatase NudK